MFLQERPMGATDFGWSLSRPWGAPTAAKVCI